MQKEISGFPLSALWWFQQLAETCDKNMALCGADGQSIFLLLLCQGIMYNLKNIYNITRNSQITLF